MDNILDRAKEIINIEIEAIVSISDNLSSSFEAAVRMLSKCNGRVALTGIGKSGLIGRKIAATLSSTGTPAYFLHPVESLHGDLGFMRPQDVVIAISYSGKTVELLALLPHIRALGASIIAMTGGLKSPLAQQADITLSCAVPREACSTNAPTSSTTATLALGDALAVCLMEEKALTVADFKRNHPGGTLGQRLALSAFDIMHKKNLPLANEDMPVEQAIKILDQYGFGIVMFTDSNNRLTGVITDGDVRRLFCQAALTPRTQSKDAMRKNPSRATPDMSAAELLEIMEQKLISALPVVNEGNVVLGLAHLHDLLGRGTLTFR
jgi:arabinose-5-phosphate isomerase